MRYRVQCLRPGHHVPGLVGDFSDLDEAREQARSVKQANPTATLTIQTGTEVPWSKQPAEQRHPYGQHFLAGDSEPEVIEALADDESPEAGD